MAIVSVALCACAGPLAPRVERFTAPPTGELTVEASARGIAYPSGPIVAANGQPLARWTIRTEVRVHNGTAGTYVVCRDPGEPTFGLGEVQIETCLRFVLDPATETWCGEDPTHDLEVLQPGEGARFEVCGAMDEPPTTASVRVLRSARRQRVNDAMVMRTAPVEIVRLPAAPVLASEYPAHVVGELEVRHVPRALWLGRHRDDEDSPSGWLVAIDVWARNATNLPLIFDSSAIRVESRPIVLQPWIENDCPMPPAPVVLEPRNRDVVTLAPGQAIERRLLYWHPQWLFERCEHRAPSELFVHPPGGREPTRVPITDAR